MKVTFIYHSGYLVELEKSVLLFDYYRGELPEIASEKKLYIFMSHRHADHCQRRLFDIFRDFPDVTFILSDDIWKRPKMHHVHFIGPRQKMTVNDLEVSTFTSTDEGVAFLVKCEDKLIYHAGDLNWWHWNGEPDAYNRMMREQYQREVDSLAEMLDGRMLDVAFVVLDARLEDAYYFGMEYFLEKIPVKTVFPMHFFEDGYEVCRQLQKSSIPGKEKVFSVEKQGQEFKIMEK